MIFVYYNKNRDIKEIITDGLPNTGNSAVDHIYIYWENEDIVPSSASAQFLRDGINTISTTPSATKVGMELPTNPLRNLSYFSYNHTYTLNDITHIGYLFYDIPIPDTLFNDFPTGADTLLAQLAYTLTTTTSTYGFGKLPFTINVSGIVLDGSINESQYKQLLKLVLAGSGLGYADDIATFSTTSEWNEFADGKIFYNALDKKFYKKLHDNDEGYTTIYEISAEYTQRYSLNSVLGYKSTITTEELAKLITNQYVLLGDSVDDYISIKVKQTDGTLKGLTIDKAFGDSDGNAINTTYLKRSGGQMTGDIDINGHRIVKLPLPTGNYQPTNKIYVDTERDTLQNNINAEELARTNSDNALSGRITTNYNSITSLSARVDDIESSQNLADIVSNYATASFVGATTLLGLDVSKLQNGDKVQVLDDETHSNSSTVYKLVNKAAITPSDRWSYIGQYASNAYNKTEADARFLNKNLGGTMGANINMDNHQITNVANPTNATDATNKQTTEAYAKSLSFRLVDKTTTPNTTYDLVLEIVGGEGVLKGIER